MKTEEPVLARDDLNHRSRYPPKLDLKELIKITLQNCEKAATLALPFPKVLDSINILALTEA